MKEKKIFDAITDLPDDLIKEANTRKLQALGRPWIKWAALAASLALFIGIASMNLKGTNSSGQGIVDIVFPKAYAFDDIDKEHQVIDENPVMDSFIDSINGFSYRTTCKIVEDSQVNLNYSPLSLYYALGMAASGAEGETLDEMLSLLGVSDKETLSKQSGNLYRQLYSDNEIGSLKIASSLWMNKEINWKDDFIKNAAEDFYASSFSMDFEDKNSNDAMGNWVSENTNAKIKPEIEIDPEQILSILNTVYFYDQWIDKFDRDKTAEDVFYLADGEEINYDFMNSIYSSAGFSRGDGFTRSSLSLKNSGSMIFILPDDGVSPKELLSSPEKMQSSFEGGQEYWGEVVWQLPKFNFGSKIKLAETLKKLGMISAFKEDANFSKITEHIAFISNIEQETHIAIDENGVEATAFTKIDYDGAALPQGRADMILNRPFIYGITASNGSLLFVGICENPTEK